MGINKYKVNFNFRIIGYSGNFAVGAVEHSACGFAMQDKAAEDFLPHSAFDSHSADTFSYWGFPDNSAAIFAAGTEPEDCSV